MRKVHAKRVIAAVLLVLAVAATWSLLTRLAGVVEAVGRGADPAGALTAAVSPVDLTGVRWSPDAPGLARPVAESTRAGIAAAYVSGLAVLEGDDAMSGSDPDAFLTGPARAALTSGAAPLVTGRGHRLQILFHSADGQLVEVEDTARLVIDTGDGFASSRTETAVAVLVQIDGTWRLRHRLVRTSTTEPIAPPAGLGEIIRTMLQAVAGELLRGTSAHGPARLFAVLGLAVAGFAVPMAIYTRRRTKQEAHHVE